MDLDRPLGPPSFQALRSAWRSELSPRPNRIVEEKDVDDDVRIEVVDVSAQLVDVASAETIDGRAGCCSPGKEKSQNAEKLSKGELPFSERATEQPNGERIKETAAQAPEFSSQDMHQDSLMKQGPPGEMKGLQTAGASKQAASNGLHISPPRPRSRNPSPKRSNSVDCSTSKRERPPSRSFLTSDIRTAHDSHLRSSGPAYRSKTPPRLHFPLNHANALNHVNGDKPLSPTQSLPSKPNGVYHKPNGGYHSRVNGEALPRKEHVVEIPAFANHTIKSVGVREADGRGHISNGYVSENGQARSERQAPPIKASSKKPPRCPTSHNSLNGDSGHHTQYNRRRRDSNELDKGKSKRGAGAAKWKMKLVTAILLACMGTLVYFQVFYMRPQQLQTIMQNANQKKVLRAGLLSSGSGGDGQDRPLVVGSEGNSTDGASGSRRKLLESVVGERILLGGVRWISNLLMDVVRSWAGFGNWSGREQTDVGLLWSGRKALAGRGGQRHERLEGLQWWGPGFFECLPRGLGWIPTERTGSDG